MEAALCHSSSTVISGSSIFSMVMARWVESRRESAQSHRSAILITWIGGGRAAGCLSHSCLAATGPDAAALLSCPPPFPAERMHLTQVSATGHTYRIQLPELRGEAQKLGAGLAIGITAQCSLLKEKS